MRIMLSTVEGKKSDFLLVVRVIIFILNIYQMQQANQEFHILYVEYTQPLKGYTKFITQCAPFFL